MGCISRPTCRVTPPREPNFWNFLMSRTDLMDDSNLHRIEKCLLLGGRWLDSKFTCLNSIQSAQLHKNVRQKTKLCHLFLICITIFSEINATNRKQNHLPRFLHNFADWIEFQHVNYESSHLLPRKIQLQFYVGKWCSWNFFLAFYIK